ncbi:MAG: NAD(P)-dependent oxidoreductase [Planctomycetota bacterium]
MPILVTGSSGYLGEALLRVMGSQGIDATGTDLVPGPFTDAVGTIADPDFVDEVVRGADSVVHAATLHKPDIKTHSDSQFMSTNVAGTLNLLTSAVKHGCKRFVFTSTTSTFGRTLRPPRSEPAAWLTESVRPVPRNIYGVTKVAAEEICELFHFRHGLPCLVLRTSRFFPEEDDNSAIRDGYDDLNAKVNELLYRRVDVSDAVDAHLLALERAESIGFRRYIISATTPFGRDDVRMLREDPGRVVSKYVDYSAEYEKRGWRLFDDYERVYDNSLARAELDWAPKISFQSAIEQLQRGGSPFSVLTSRVASRR